MFPHSLTQPGLGDTDSGVYSRDTQLDQYLIQQMHALAISIYQAKQRNDKVTVAALATRFRDLAEQFRGNAQADLTGTDRFLLAVDRWVSTSVGVIPDAISALPVAIGKGVFQAVLPFALMYVGFLYLTSPRRKF
jgi:hypothetical protein